MKSAEYLAELQSVINRIDTEKWDDAVSLINSCHRSENTVFTCGNGGSALTASHYITDWNKMSLHYNGKALKGMCLNDNMGILTAYANDYSYDDIFSEQLRFFAKPNDLLVVVSGSGNSRNILKVLETAKQLKLRTLAVVGFDGGKAASLADSAVHVPVMDMQLSEDLHLVFGHMVMKKLCSKA